MSESNTEPNLISPYGGELVDLLVAPEEAAEAAEAGSKLTPEQASEQAKEAGEKAGLAKEKADVAQELKERFTRPVEATTVDG